MYGLLTAIVVFRSIYVMEVNIRPKFQERAKREVQRATRAGKAEQDRQDERDKDILRRMWMMIACGLSIFLGGFAIWNVDNEFCSTLRMWRRQVGLPWGILLEGHGWWHLMTGTGAYFYIQWGIWLRHCLNANQDNYELQWPRIFSIPAVVRLPESTIDDGQVERTKKSL